MDPLAGIRTPYHLGTPPVPGPPQAPAENAPPQPQEAFILSNGPTAPAAEAPKPRRLGRNLMIGAMVAMVAAPIGMSLYQASMMNKIMTPPPISQSQPFTPTTAQPQAPVAQQQEATFGPSIGAFTGVGSVPLQAGESERAVPFTIPLTEDVALSVDGHFLVFPSATPDGSRIELSQQGGPTWTVDRAAGLTSINGPRSLHMGGDGGGNFLADDPTTMGVDYQALKTEEGTLLQSADGGRWLINGDKAETLVTDLNNPQSGGFSVHREGNKTIIDDMTTEGDDLVLERNGNTTTVRDLQGKARDLTIKHDAKGLSVERGGVEAMQLRHTEDGRVIIKDGQRTVTVDRLKG